MKLVFTIPGPPVPCARARVTSKRAFTPIATRAYEKRVGAYALQARCAAKGWRLDWGTYSIRVQFFRSADRGDADNYLKSVLDGATGVLFDDDDAVATTAAEMHLDRVNPRAVVEVEMVGQETREERRKRIRRERAAERRAEGR